MPPDINRSLMVVKPKQPFLEWVRSMDQNDKELSLDYLRKDSSVYLIPEYESDDDELVIVKWCYQDVFEEELNSWYTDETVWPQPRTFELFLEWFDLEFHSMVFDLDDETRLEHNDYTKTLDEASPNGGNGFKGH